MAVDKAWFVDRLEKARKSVRGLARFLDLDPSAVSRMLNGERRMKPSEADKIARFLGETIEEVVKRGDVEVPATHVKRITLDARVTESGKIERLSESHELPPSILARAQAAIVGTHGPLSAAQVRAVKGALALFDDAVLVFEEPSGVEPAAVGVLSVMKLREGVTMIGHLDKARKTGEATVRTAGGETKNVILISATPVLAIVP